MGWSVAIGAILGIAGALLGSWTGGYTGLVCGCAVGGAGWRAWLGVRAGHPDAVAAVTFHQVAGQSLG